MIAAVILAAGRGTRLRPRTENQPKPLISIFGKPIIEHTLFSLRKAGVKSIILVIGYLGDYIKKHLGDGSHLGLKIQYCHNPHYMLENAISLKVADKFLQRNKPFLLLMGDHYFDEVMIEEAVKNSNRQPLLCIDKNPLYPPQVKDATRVLVNEEGYIIDIGKNISVWNATDTGLFLLDNLIFDVIALLERQKPNLTITDCIKHLSLNVKPVWGCDVTGHLWFDIDTPEDVKFVESFLCRGGNVKCQENGME